MSTKTLKPSDISDGVTCRNQATNEAAAERPPARTRAKREADGRTRGEDSLGAPHTNRAPLKYNPEKSKLLRFGVDSLYLSYPGVMSEDWDKKLAKLKELAQMEDELSQSIAQVTICEHLFEVRDKGAGRFSYVLVDNAYRIQASNSRSKSLFVHGLGGITSFMASRGIEDIGEGIGEYLQQAKQFHVARSGFKHDGMERYVGRKVKVKNRRYNTVQNGQPLEYQSIEAAVAYQNAKDGDDGDA